MPPERNNTETDGNKSQQHTQSDDGSDTPEMYENGVGVLTIAIVVFTPLILLMVIASGTPQAEGITPVKPNTAEIESGMITTSASLNEGNIMVIYNSSYNVTDVEYEIKNPYYDTLVGFGRVNVELVPEQRVFKLPYDYSPGILRDRFKGSSGIKYHVYYKKEHKYVSNETITLKNTTT